MGEATAVFAAEDVYGLRPGTLWRDWFSGLRAGLKFFSKTAFRPDRSGDGSKDRSGGESHGESEAESEAGADQNSGEDWAAEAQPSDPDGVREDMATLVLDKPTLGPGLGAGHNTWLGPDGEAGARGIHVGNQGGIQGGIQGRNQVNVDPNSDAAVMLRVAEGDESSFNYLVEKYHRPMIHFLFRMVHNQAVAEELTQEVFLRVYRARDSYRAEARFTTWLYRIATNLAVNHARDTRHERTAQTVYLDEPDPETGTTPDVADSEMTVEEKLMREERMGAIRAHVMELPERQRVAVLMHKYQGMDYREIGEVLKLSESATKSLLFRAYQTLRTKLKEFV